MNIMSEKPLIVQLAESDQLQQQLGLSYIQKIKNVDEDDGRVGTGTRKPKGLEVLGLRSETRQMEIDQRKLEQAGHRQYAQINAREKNPNEPTQSPELDQGNGMKEHPLLQNQRYDGTDGALNPSPPNNPDALWIYENERQEEEKAKELRLGNELSNTKQYQPGMMPRPGG